MMVEPSMIVYTDLDGTLLDHYNYNFEAAKPVIATLKSKGIPIIPNTSKTFAELIELQKRLQLDGPFIVENGAAVYIPQSYFDTQPVDTEVVGEYWRKAFAPSRQHWLEHLNQLPSGLCDAFVGFSQMSSTQIAEETGLSKEDALLASKKQFSEPIKWLGNERQKQQLALYLSDRGANMLEGGRFFHISGQTNKGSAMRWLTDLYRSQTSLSNNKVITSVALGDSYNDIDMLEVATVAVQIRSHKHNFPRLKRVNSIIQTELYGPEGWAESITKVLSKFNN